METWLAVPGYAGLYEVSDLGDMRSLDRTVMFRPGTSPEWWPKQVKGKVLAQKIRRQSPHYYQVQLSREGRTTSFCVHTLVMLAHVGPPEDGQEVRHGPARDDAGCPLNHLSNLSYSTHLINMQDRLRAGTYARGEQNNLARLTEASVRDIRSSSESGVYLATKYGVSRPTISHIRTRKTWKHVL